MMRTLVIGGSGFIGQNVVNYLLDHGVDVSVYARESFPVSQYPYYCRDLTTDEELHCILPGFDVVIYLVTASTPLSSMENSDIVYEKDIPLLIKVLNCCVKSGVRRVIYASSGGTVYGESSLANRESVEAWPLCHYAIGKLTCEKILHLYNKIYGMENISLRISNPFGIGQSLKSGIGAVTAFTHCIISKKQITLYGDGNAQRDFIRVDYVAEAFYRALFWAFDSDCSCAFNIGSGKSLTLSRVISLISEAVKQDAQVVYLPARPFDVTTSRLDIGKAVSCLGFKPPEDPESEIAAYAVFVKEGLFGGM